MGYTDEELTQIKEHGHDLMTWRDIAYLMGKDIDEFYLEFSNKKSRVYIAYRTGIAERKKKLRQPVLKMAEHGSPQAELLADKLMEDQILSEQDEP